MIFKLIKHDWKATYRVFALLYLALFLATMVIYGSFQWGNDILQAFSSLLLALGIMPVTAVYCATIFNSYTRSIYADESYLTHTLPVKGRTILLSKWIMASFWGVLTLIVGCICGILLVLGLAWNTLSWNDFFRGFDLFFQTFGFSNCVLIAIIIIISCIQLLVKVYFAIAVSKLPFITRFNNLLGVVVFLVASFFQDKLYAIVVNQIPEQVITGSIINEANAAVELSRILQNFSIFHILFTVVFAAIYFAATAYLLERKLHIR